MGCMFPYLLLLKQIYSLVKMKKTLLIVTFFLFLLSNSCIGKKIAECRLTNEKETETTADEIWAIHDVYLDWQGKIIVDDKEHEYSDTRMVKKYSSKKKSDMLLVKGFCDVK